MEFDKIYEQLGVRGQNALAHLRPDASALRRIRRVAGTAGKYAVDGKRRQMLPLFGTRSYRELKRALNSTPPEAPSPSPKMTYAVSSGTSPSDLVTDVNNWMLDGYTPQGGMAVVVVGGMREYFQAMIKREA